MPVPTKVRPMTNINQLFKPIDSQEVLDDEDDNIMDEFIGTNTIQPHLKHNFKRSKNETIFSQTDFSQFTALSSEIKSPQFNDTQKSKQS